MEAIDLFRDTTENNEEEAEHGLGTTKLKNTMVGQEDYDSGTMIRPAETTDVEPGSYDTMVFNGKPDLLKDNDSSSSYYGTMVFRGSGSGTMVKSNASDAADDDRDEPSFMKYFRKSKPTTLDALKGQMEELRVKYEADKAQLEAKYEEDCAALRSRMRELE